MKEITKPIQDEPEITAVPDGLVKIGCSCWVNTKPKEQQWAILYKDHSETCFLYRK